ncbi:MAG: hypothetical protein KDD25_10040, partial [Bdellovibrionales bacterium]|nr:hypothetical protein [Bdellovibrionales bacterium]
RIRKDFDSNMRDRQKSFNDRYRQYSKEYNDEQKRKALEKKSGNSRFQITKDRPSNYASDPDMKYFSQPYTGPRKQLQPTDGE